MSRSAFLVIDMLNDFFLEEPLSSRRSGLVSAINDLVRIFRENGQPIIWVRQEFKPDLSDAFLAMRKEDTRITIAGTDGAQILPELDVQPADHVIVKQRFDNDIYVNYSRKEIVSRVEDIEHELVREAMYMTGVRSGVEITTLADIPSAGSGLGSSSAVTVGLLHALFAYQ